MLMITLVESSKQSSRLRLEGRLVGRWVDELRRCCDAYAPNDRTRLILDLAAVSFVDDSGIKLLKELRGHQITLLSPSPFVADRLRQAMTRRGPRNRSSARGKPGLPEKSFSEEQR